MKKTPLVLMSLAACLAASLTVSASAQAPSTPRSSKSGGIVRGDLGPAKNGAKRTARTALARKAKRLRIDASQFRFETVRRSIVGRHVRGSQYRDGVRVEGGEAIVSIVKGRIVWVQAKQIHAAGSAVATPIGTISAERAGLAAVGLSTADRTSVERLMTVRAGRLVDTYRVSILSLAPAVAMTVDLDAGTGAVLAVTDDNRYDDAVATLFNPNPIASSKDKSIREPGYTPETGEGLDLDSEALNAALEDMPILGYDPQQALAGRLVGPWATVQGGAPMVQLTAGRFEFNRSDLQFEGLMAYAHVDLFQRYLQNVLGFTGAAGVNAESQDMYALRVEGFDNSFYQPGNDLMLFGAGGVDDAEDADVILHEYGHAVQDAQVDGWGATTEGGAMGEGFGDFQAAAYYARISEGFQDECVADWDATTYSSADPTCLRRTDSTKHWPEDKAERGSRRRRDLGDLPLELAGPSRDPGGARHALCR